MARRVLMEKSVEAYHLGTRETKVRLDGWCVGDLGKQRNDGGGCVTMLERSERVESPGIYVTK